MPADAYGIEHDEDCVRRKAKAAAHGDDNCHACKAFSRCTCDPRWRIARLEERAEQLLSALATIERSGAPGGSIVAKRTDGHACQWCRGMYMPCPVACAAAALAEFDKNGGG